MAIEVGQEALTSPSRTPRTGMSRCSPSGDKNVVLVFYPLAFSSARIEAADRDRRARGRYAEGDAQVIGVSVRPLRPEAVRGDLGLRDTILLADFEPKGAVSRSYGVFLEEWFSGPPPSSSTRRAWCGGLAHGHAGRHARRGVPALSACNA